MVRSKKLDVHKLRIAITESGKTKSQICEDLGYSSSWIGSMISDERISHSSDVALARYFGYDGSFVLEENVTESPAQEETVSADMNLTEANELLKKYNDLLELQNNILDEHNKNLNNTMKSMNGGFVAMECRMGNIEKVIGDDFRSIGSQLSNISKTLTYIGNVLVAIKNHIEE